MPQVSVIIPAYNAKRWLSETLDSVSAQRFSDMEVIIIDDGSTDGTQEYVEIHWPQFKLVRTANHGVSHARNLGTSLATGDFIQHLDADDLLMPGKLARQVQMLVAEPTVDIIYSNWQRLVQTNADSFEPAEKVERTIEEVHSDPQLAFFSTMWCPTGAYLYRRSFLQKVGEWKSSLPVVQDARFAWDCVRAGARWGHDAHIGALYRQHQTGSISTRSHLAFLRDCWQNNIEMAEIWNEEGSLFGERRKAVVANCSALVRSFYETDRPMFEAAYAYLQKLDPHFRPDGVFLPLLSSALGYRNAEAIALCFRKLKSCFINPRR